VTGLASEIFDFISDVGDRTLFLRLMTFRTGNINMFPVKPESCPVMIEPTGLPGLSSVAIFAGCYTVLLKLPVMIISMAAGTVR